MVKEFVENTQQVKFGWKLISVEKENYEMFYVKEKCFCTKSVSKTAGYIFIHNVVNDQLTNFIDMDI